MHDNGLMSNAPCALRLRGDRGMVGQWLLRMGIWFAVAGVILFDAGSIAVAFFGLDGRANEIATIVSNDIGGGQLETPVTIEDSAKALAKESDARLLRAEVDQEGVLHIKLRQTAPTLLVGRIGPIEDWAVLTAEATSHTK